jgi:hypothetical protein
MQKIERRFFWQKNYHMVRWELICKPKSIGVLGVKKIEIFQSKLVAQVVVAFRESIWDPSEACEI